MGRYDACPCPCGMQGGHKKLLARNGLLGEGMQRRAGGRAGRVVKMVQESGANMFQPEVLLLVSMRCNFSVCVTAHSSVPLKGVGGKLLRDPNEEVSMLGRLFHCPIFLHRRPR